MDDLSVLREPCICQRTCFLLTSNEGFSFSSSAFGLVSLVTNVMKEDALGPQSSIKLLLAWGKFVEEA